ncbi:MAG: tRNA (adenosine(37)-N6)-threonylcarbamoyltransferase complex transferase subunit TsaD [Clostridiales bacterium]|nr:tRNA (adenosine(37)-N6)-threonylcarbamoyltransferase complex transferase subunit TsaD [Clostridiales bacterium]
MLVLGIESSCDETAVSVCRMENGRREVLSNCIASQIAIHKLYGGVVPEIASRAHAEAISGLCRQAIQEAGVTMQDIELVGVTNAPGLVGALLVGVSFAKGLAFANHKPFVAVNHIAAHIAAAYINAPELKPPFFALVASGGHTSMIHVKSYTEFETVGRTRDDAAGEAFDKIARVMGMPYPGGAEMDRAASQGQAVISFPSAAIADDTLDFSFSGLKTAVMNYLHTREQRGEEVSVPNVAASLTSTICASVVKKLTMAWDRYHFHQLVLAGGVAANTHLRAALAQFCEQNDISFYVPPKHLCGDNGAMVAVQAYYEYEAGHRAAWNLNAVATGKK